MIEQIMLFGIGFLVASLFNLLFVPLVHNRAVRLTMRRLAAATPFSMAEIQAEKDQLRAEFALSTRRLEMSVEQLKAKTATQLGEIGKKSMAIGKLKQELDEKNAAILAGEARETALQEQLQTTEHEYTLKSDKAQSVEARLGAKESELATLVAALDERTAVSDSQRIEISTLKTQIESLKTQLSQAFGDLKETAQRMEQERLAAAAASQELARARAHGDELGARIEELERQLAGQTSDAEAYGRRIQELEDRLADQGRMLVERAQEAAERAEVARLEGAPAETPAVAAELQALREKNARLESEIAAARQGAEDAWATERVETALLRERINDIAAEVVRLTRTLEGEESPIDKILAEAAPAAPIVAPDAARNGTAAPQGGDLIERIRALQARAARPAPAAAPAPAPAP